jgi:SAM-dependent methyltransferase
MRSGIEKVLPTSAREIVRRVFEKASNFYLRRLQHVTRSGFSHAYIRGEGIEFGALNSPLPVAKGVVVRYADRYTNAFIQARHEGMPKDLKPLTYITNLETCEGIPDASQDFIIANHVVEHLENPLLAIQNMLRILKVGGIVFLALPDRRFTFDFDRDLTTFEHLLSDYENGPAGSRFGHYLEISEKLFGLAGAEARGFAEQLDEDGLDAHFHVWEQHTAMEMILRCKTQLGFPLEILVNSNYPNETLFILRKIDPAVPLPRPETTSLFSVEKHRRAKWVEEQIGNEKT